jgi:hypothetical protein
MIDLHCQGRDNGDIFEDRAVVLEVCPLILEVMVFMDGAKYCFMLPWSIGQVNGVVVPQLL